MRLLFFLSNLFLLLSSSSSSPSPSSSTLCHHKQFIHGIQRPDTPHRTTFAVNVLWKGRVHGTVEDMDPLDSLFKASDGSATTRCKVTLATESAGLEDELCALNEVLFRGQES